MSNRDRDLIQELDTLLRHHFVSFYDSIRDENQRSEVCLCCMSRMQ